jgi:hypothetical protein
MRTPLPVKTQQFKNHSRRPDEQHFCYGWNPSYFIAGMVMDGAGNVFGMAQNIDSPSDPNAPSTLYKITPDGVVSPLGLQSDCIQSDGSHCSAPGQSIGLAIDGAGNLFAADSIDLIIYKFTPAGVRSIFASPATFPFTATQYPIGLAFDGSGNLFVSTNGTGSNDAILKFTPDGTGSTVHTGLISPKGLVFDTVGNLFVAEVPLPQTTGDILKFTPGSTEGTVVDSNDGPEFLAFPPTTHQCERQQRV